MELRVWVSVDICMCMERTDHARWFILSTRVIVQVRCREASGEEELTWVPLSVLASVYLAQIYLFSVCKFEIAHLIFKIFKLEL